MLARRLILLSFFTLFLSFVALCVVILVTASYSCILTVPFANAINVLLVIHLHVQKEACTRAFHFDRK